MKTLTGVLALMLALMFGAYNVVVAAEKAAAPAERYLKMEKVETERKAGEMPAVSPPAGQKDLCADNKKDSKKYADCQNAVKLGSTTLSRRDSKHKSDAVTVCSGGYWWTIQSLGGPITQGGKCSQEGAIK